jgi:hypothetical protein
MVIAYNSIIHRRDPHALSIYSILSSTSGRIRREYHSRHPTRAPILIADDDDWHLSHGPSAQLLALAEHHLMLEDGPKILDQETPENEHGDGISSGLSPEARLMEQAWIQAQ